MGAFEINYDILTIINIKMCMQWTIHLDWEIKRGKKDISFDNLDHDINIGIAILQNMNDKICYKKAIQIKKKNKTIEKISWFCYSCTPGPEVIKPFSCSAQMSMKFQLLLKIKTLNNKDFICFKLSYAVFILVINVKMTTIVGILTFMSMINLMLS